MRLTPHNPDESTARWRQRLLDDTSRFIEWGLLHPDKVEWIPRHPVGQGHFSERVKTIFWGLVLNRHDWPD